MEDALLKRYDYRYPADPEAMGYVPSDAFFLDIETTGIKKESAIITLIGCGYAENETLHVIQWFNDDAVSEEAMLRELEAFLSSRPFTLVTYNGAYFDLPFLKAHYYYNEMAAQKNYHPVIDGYPSIDLFQSLRCYAPLFPEGRTRQKALERYLGIDREDRYGGGELISVYRDYLRTKEESFLTLLLLHNREDVRYLASIPALLSLHQLKDGSFSIESMEETTFRDQTALRFLCRPELPIPGRISMETDDARVELNPGMTAYDTSQVQSGTDQGESGNCFSVTIPVLERKMYHFYKDYKDYIYLPLEDRAVHKSVGIYVEKDHRCKATPRNCYCPADSVFLPLPPSRKGYGFHVDLQEKISLPLYRKTYEDKKYYLNFDDLFSGQDSGKLVRQYLTAVIHIIFYKKNKELKKSGNKKRKKTFLAK